MASPSNAESSAAGSNPHGLAAPHIDLVEAHCALCGARTQEPEAFGYDFEYNTTSNPFRFVRCAECRHVYLSPRPAPSDLGVIYPAHYYTLAGTGSLVARLQRVWEGKKVGVYRDALGSGPKRILDVGCGDGRFLEVLRDFGSKEWELVGVDFDPAAVERCRARGFTAHAKRVEDMEGENGTFDAVVMLQLIEHVEDPVVIARRVFSLLRPGGVFVVETPNLAGWDYHLFRKRWWGHYHFPRHWNLFSKESLETMLERAGFVIDRTEQLISTSAWTISFGNYFLDKGYPSWFAKFWNFKNPLLLAVFVTLDTVRSRLGAQTSNQRVIARKP
ncbi:MAG TPA: class I SAM-dependent methyltransferase [Polyangiaceae bacterium]|jgi:SAM-dependent methyltransferase|nr:class I SAM-dependent methyltransferase [Polyangiaceae bacterium]